MAKAAQGANEGAPRANAPVNPNKPILQTQPICKHAVAEPQHRRPCLLIYAAQCSNWKNESAGGLEPLVESLSLL
eukprot:224337-Chlamydomonas_euryale.AAC.6